MTIYQDATEMIGKTPLLRLGRLAKEHGALLVIINRNETALDDMADILLRGETGEILPALN